MSLSCIAVLHFLLHDFRVYYPLQNEGVEPRTQEADRRRLHRHLLVS